MGTHLKFGDEFPNSHICLPGTAYVVNTDQSNPKMGIPRRHHNHYGQQDKDGRQIGYIANGDSSNHVFRR